MNTLDFMKQVIYDHSVKRMCRLCGQEKFLYELSKGPNSLFGRKLLCKECDRAKVSGRTLTHKEKINKIKDVPCKDCGGKFPPECMTFDHLPEFVKSFGLGGGQSRKWSTIEAEMAKCEVVCANCHAIRTRTRLVK